MVSEKVIDAGCKEYSRFRNIFDILILPYTSRRLGMAAAFEAMKKEEAKERVNNAMFFRLS